MLDQNVINGCGSSYKRRKPDPLLPPHGYSFDFSLSLIPLILCVSFILLLFFVNETLAFLVVLMVMFYRIEKETG